MSDLPIDPEVSYVSKATFLHLWDKFKQQEKDLEQANSIKESFAKNVLRLGDECRDQADQLKGLKEELARVMEDLHTANDVLASIRSDHKWLISCHKTQRTVYAQHILEIAKAVAGICQLNDKSQPSEHEAAWENYADKMGKATDLFNQ
jgi:predicted transcriptional regulator